MTTKEFIIENMSCIHCVMAINKELGKLDLDEFQVQIGSVNVRYDESKVNEEQIIAAIDEAGYKVSKD